MRAAAPKRYFSRAEWRFLIVCAVLAVTLTVWFPFPSYFLVEAEAEQVSVAIDPDSALEWSFAAAELIPDEGAPFSITGTVTIRSKDPITVRRIEKGSLKITLPKDSDVTITPSGNLQRLSPPADTFPAVLVVSPPQASTVVLPISGSVTVGRDPRYTQSQPDRPVLLSGSVEIQARAIDGRAVVNATDQKMYMGDSLSFRDGINGNGLMRIGEDAGIKLFFAINARQASIQRFGSAKPILIQASFIQRITSDKILEVVWGTFIFLSGLLFFRRSLLSKK